MRTPPTDTAWEFASAAEMIARDVVGSKAAPSLKDFTLNSFENIRMLHTNIQIQKTETRMCKALEQSANIFGSRRSSCWVDSMNTKLSLDM